MKSAGNIFITLVIVTGIFLIFSGCTTSQKDLFSKPTLSVQQSPAVPSITTYEKHWIRIDPISDFRTDLSFNITGSSILNVTGTTDFPAGTTLRFAIIDENGDRDLLRTTIEIRSNNSGPNSFSYGYEMKGNPPGQYRVIIRDDMSFTSTFSRFNITSGIPYYKSIRMNPLGDIHPGDRIPIAGTTDLPAGSEILIRSDISYHSCFTPATPDRFGERSLCGGSCRDTGSPSIIRVTEGSGGINPWNSTVDTSKWCFGEEYRINAFAVNWTNVSSGGQSIRF